MTAGPRLIAVADGLWTFEGRVALGLGIVFPARSVLARLDDGTLALHSPLPIDDALAAEIDAVGEVKHLIAPNLFHHLYFGPACERWPNAKRYGAYGFAKKRPDLTFDVVLGQDDASALAGFEPIGIRGMKANETLFFHAASGTLVVTDLVFNLRSYHTKVSAVFFRLLGVHGKVAQSPIVRWATNDRAAAGAGCREALSRPFDRLVVAHGPVVETGGKAALEHALAWMLGGEKALSA